MAICKNGVFRCKKANGRLDATGKFSILMQKSNDRLGKSGRFRISL